MTHLPDPLSDEDLKAYNNLPAIPYDRPLGDILQGVLLTEGALGVYKTADTSRASNATPAADPELVLTSVPSGYAYKIDAMIFASLSGDGIQAGLSGSLTFSDLKAQVSIYDTVLRECGRVTAFGTTVSHGSAGTGDHWVRILGTVVVTGTGGLSVIWAQATPNVNPLIFQKSSYLRLTPI